jgi:hypothetical protein
MTDVWGLVAAGAAMWIGWGLAFAGRPGHTRSGVGAVVFLLASMAAGWFLCGVVAP